MSALIRGCLLAAVAEAMPLAVIYLVAIIMACDMHRFRVRGRTIEFDMCTGWSFLPVPLLKVPARLRQF